jgi:acetyl-CoA C-acetyltransferase
MTACIVGWGHTRFGRLDHIDLEGLITSAAREAVDHAGIAPADIDEIYLGTFNGGMDRQEFAGSLVLELDDHMRFTPVTRVENACATGSAAIYQGIDAIEAGRARIALAVGVEKMTACSGEVVTDVLSRGAYQKEVGDEPLSFPGLFALLTQQYFQCHGDQSEALARIAAKNHRNGAVNPLAHLQKDLGYEFCRTESDKNPMAAPPLKRSDCSTVADGAAAVMLADIDTALGMERAVVFRARQHVQDFLPMSKRDILAFEGPARAWRKALDQAGMTLDDLDLAEVHDCFTTAELLIYEAMGLAEPGHGAQAILEGWTEKDGKMPINASGGLKAKGHPIGATGVSMHALAAAQVSGAAGAIQVPGASTAAVFNMGGMAVANYASILEPLR